MASDPWKDITGYRMGQRGKAEHRSWQHPSGVVVTRYLNYPGWFWCWSKAGADRVPLACDDIDDAKVEAIHQARHHIKSLLAKLPEVPDGE